MRFRKSCRYILFSQSRSGTQLMRWLMDCHPDIRAEGEILHHGLRYTHSRLIQEPARLLPELLMWGRGGLENQPVYGCTLMFYHPRFPGFTFRRLAALGYRFVHLFRDDPLAIAWSYLIAEKSGTWHAKKEAPPVDYTVRIEPAELQAELEKRVLYRRQQLDLIAKIPHVTVSYNEDLRNQDGWQAALDRVFDYLDLPPAPVSAPLRKTDARAREEVIENHGELMDWLCQSPYSDLQSKTG